MPTQGGSGDGRGVSSTSADRIKWTNLFWFCFHGHGTLFRVIFSTPGDTKKQQLNNEMKEKVLTKRECRNFLAASVMEGNEEQCVNGG